MSNQFVHLHVRSEYSIVDSIVPVQELTQAVKQQGMNACAMTDVCNLFGMIKFYKASVKQGIQPIIGNELWIRYPTNQNSHKVVLLCQNRKGYANLVNLISMAYQQGQRDIVPFVEMNWLAGKTDGLIALSGGVEGEIGQLIIQDNIVGADAALNNWMSLFPNRFYLELNRTSKINQSQVERKTIELAQAKTCPLVATNEVTFLLPEDFEAHKAKVCIQEGMTIAAAVHPQYSREQYLKSADEMQKLFQDIPAAIQNTVEIAKRCALTFELDHPILPSFPVPATSTEPETLEQSSFLGLEKRLAFMFQMKGISDEKQLELRAHYQDRLKIELETIIKMGFSGYFLIVADFIQWAKNNKIPVGPGRGSGAGSLVAYALEITDLDPIEYELLFERFLNPERVSMPDFDIDFCMDNRDRVIEYVMERYGRDNVSQISTFGTMAAKAVIRDVGRVLGHPYGFVDKIAKLIPFEIGITIQKALEDEPALKKRFDEEEEVKTLITLAQKLEGITRNVGKHAGGVVIAPSKLTDFAPLYTEEAHANVVIQLDKDDVEAIGLTKFDFLGLRTLTIIDWALKIVNANLAKQDLPLVNIAEIPLNCPKTFALLKDCATTAVFQLESRGMKELIKRLQPDQFEEIIALVALFRPGPLQSGMVDDFINRKHGRQKLEFLHPTLEPILKPTYGVILYQEQVMQIAQTLSGYTLGSADLLRRAMGKKKPEEMAKQRESFVLGAVERGVEEKMATHIFDLIEKFAGYGFNKSHSAAYALVSYQTAWLKAHYPSAFMAAVLSSDMNHTDKVVNMLDECKRSGIKVLNPDIHFSEFSFTVNEKSEIVYGLGAIKGLGEAAINSIIEQRQRQPFRDFSDFCQRMDHRKINKRVFECLIKSGTLDPFGIERSYMMAQLPSILQQSEQQAQNQARGQFDLFGASEMVIDERLGEVKPWTSKERLQGEIESLGTYVSGHPVQIVEPMLKKISAVKYRDIRSPKKDQKFILAGTIVSIKSLQTKNGDRMAVILLDDSIERFEVTVFSEPFQLYRELLIKDSLVILEVTAQRDAESGIVKVRTQKVDTLESYQAKHAKQLYLKLHPEQVNDDFINKIKDCLILSERGACPIYFDYFHHEAQVRVKLDDKWNVQISERLINQLRETVGETALDVLY